MKCIEKNTAETIISRSLFNFFSINSHITCLGVYFPILQEPNLHFFYSILRKHGVHLCLPKIHSKNFYLDFISWMSDDILIKDSHGVFAPLHGKTIKPNAILIPCLGFNRDRVRLGYGGGYYDRTLAKQYQILLHQQLVTIGIAYANTQVDFISEAHDIALDIIITG